MIPVEVVLAAGYTPLDLNNLFISDIDSISLVEDAEKGGFPRSCCAWIKGIYALLANGRPSLPLSLFVAVTEGDCSNARVLKEIIELHMGIPSYLFAFPQDRSPEAVRAEVVRFANFLGTTIDAAETVRYNLRQIRKVLEEIDDLSWRYPGLVPGSENHLLLVSASDFAGDVPSFTVRVQKYLALLEQKLATGQWRKCRKPLAYLGVPPIYNLYNFIEEKGAIVVFNEMQREFAMLGGHTDLAEQYRAYSYPYSAEYRFSKAIAEIRRRGVVGIIHYVQSFCHRQIEDIILRRMLREAGLDLPILTLEGDKPQKELDGRQKTRLEAFIEMV